MLDKALVENDVYALAYLRIGSYAPVSPVVLEKKMLKNDGRCQITGHLSDLGNMKTSSIGNISSSLSSPSKILYCNISQSAKDLQ